MDAQQYRGREGPDWLPARGDLQLSRKADDLGVGPVGVIAVVGVAGVGDSQHESLDAEDVEFDALRR
ncbi:hypothetical protein ABZ783_24780 [Micromonospora sp. NPDC047738]|uniref:hypothetical protein n=1 Tax=Micromonospora sp. NPDC047738 TaxID=3155741 RepID=UPI0033EEB842